MSEIMDLSVACQSFPELPVPMIEFRNFLDTLDTMFDNDIELVVAEGEEGIGKTILLAQFVKRYPNRALSVFIRPTSHYGYDPQMLRFDLANQIQWLLSGEELSSIDQATDASLRNCIAGLHRYTRYRNRIFFVIDGLHEVPEESSYVVDAVIDMLPLGLPGFRFLMSGDLNVLNRYLPDGIQSKSYPLSGFTVGQISEYLAEFGLDSESINQINKLCRNVPGRLYAVKRILRTRVGVNALLEEAAGHPLFEIEWKRIRHKDDAVYLLLALIAHDSQRHTVSELAQVAELPSSRAREILSDISFLSVEPEHEEVTFVSEAFRKFSAHELRHLREEAYERLIGYLLSDPDSESARRHLPGYLEQASRSEQILSYLSADHFPQVLRYSQSLGPVKQQARLGLDTALSLGRDADLVRFGVHHSMMSSLGSTRVWQSEIEARMALGDDESAKDLALASILKEERLQALAIVARVQSRKGLGSTLDVRDQIRQLCAQIDFHNLGHRQAMEIASDLVHTEPDLAIQMVENSTNTDVESHALDWAFMKLAVETTTGDREHKHIDTVNSIQSRVQDPDLRDFLRSVSLLVSDSQASEIVAWVKTNLADLDKQLYLLRRWALENREREDAIEVTKYALSLTLKATPYSPNAGVFREIATPLAFSKDSDAVRELVRSFDAQKGTIERFGPTEDYIRLQLVLMLAEAEYDFDVACNRFIEVYSYISGLDDLSVRVSCLARAVSTLSRIDPEMKLEAQAQTHSGLKKKLLSDVQALVECTAEHYLLVRNVVRGLAKTNAQMALEITQSLNTEARRELALSDLVKSASDAPLDQLDFDLMASALNLITDLNLRAETLIDVLDKLVLQPAGHTQATRSSLMLLNRVDEIRDAYLRCNACCLAYSFLQKQNSERYSGFLNHLLTILDGAWQSIDVVWRKVDAGFKIARSLAEFSVDHAECYLARAEEFRKSCSFYAESSAESYRKCLQLAIRAYEGLLPTDLDGPEDIERLDRLISKVPSSGEQAKLWSELALRCYAGEKPKLVSNIVVQHIRPCLQDISEEDHGYRSEIVIAVAPVLYLAHKVTAFELLSELSQDDQDEACGRICEFLLIRQPHSDAYQAGQQHGYRLTRDTIVDLCEVLERVDNDSLIYSVIVNIVDSVISRHTNLNRHQRADVAQRLMGLIDSNLPSPSGRFIQHEGYKIAARAQIARLQHAHSETWIELISDAERIPNLSDKAFVLSIIASVMTSRERERREEVIDRAQELTTTIPATLDRLERYEDLASLIMVADSARAKESLSLAFGIASANKAELYPHQRRIINLAYQIDGDFARSLASVSDDDPARTKTRANLKWQLQVLDLKSRMLKADCSADDLTSNVGVSLSRAAWMALGTLNAGRATPCAMDSIRDFVSVAADRPIQESYPVFAWAIENAKRRWADWQTRQRLRPMFEALVLGCELAVMLDARSSEEYKRLRIPSSEVQDSQSITIRADERDKALRIIGEWFRQHVEGYLKICDAFFGPEDLDVLQLLRSMKQDCYVQILTSRKHQTQQQVQEPWSTTYRDHWRFQISPDQDPPDTQIIVIGAKSTNSSPIHDRWWLTKDSGLRVGSSLNSLGLGGKSEISYLTETEAHAKEREIDQYLDQSERHYNGERLLYESFNL